MKKTFIIALALAIVAPMSVQAANFTFVPAVGNYHTGDTITTSVYVNPGAGETITATKVMLNFPASKLEVTAYTPTSGGNILAHVGSKTDNTAGTVVDNVAFNPGITASTKVATITFKAKADGQTTVSVSSSAKLLDNNNADKTGTSPSAVFTVSAPAPVVPTTQPKSDATITPPSLPKTPTTGAKGNTTGKKSLSKTTTTIATTTAEATTTTETATTSTSTDQLAAAANPKSSNGGMKWYYWLGIFIVLTGFFLIWKRKKDGSN